MSTLEMKELSLKDKRVIIREDLNVPLKDGRVQSDARILRALPTIQTAIEKGAAVILLSHLGRPKEGEYDSTFSLEPVAKRLSELLSQPVRFEKDWLGGVTTHAGEVVLCENVRFCKGEKANDSDLAKKIAALGDVFVMDAFATAHRAHASTEGVARFAKEVAKGPLLTAELNALEKALATPQKPVLAIVGGAKVSSKLGVIDSLIDKVDVLILGGGIANTFLKAKGLPVGGSLYEPELIEQANEYLAKAREKGCEILLPTDVVVADDIEATQTKTIAAKAVSDEDKIFDIGPQTIDAYASAIANSGTILWNGPVGVFECTPFEKGTKALSDAIAECRAFSIAGGGDTLAAIDKYNIEKDVSYISTGGGAFLEWVEGKELPGVKVLTER